MIVTHKNVCQQQKKPPLKSLSVLIGTLTTIVALSATPGYAQSSYSSTPECISSSLISSPSAHCAASFGGLTVDNQVRQLDAIANGMLAAPAMGVYSEGKLRSIEHDGYKNQNNIPGFSMEGTEVSAYAGAVYTLPGKYDGGSWQLGGFGGYTKLEMDFGAPAGVAGGKQGEATHEALIVGGMATYRKGMRYLNLSSAIMPGQNTIDANEFDSLGIMAAVKMGQVFDWTNSLGVKADARVGLTYSIFDGDSFRVGNVTEESNAEALLAMASLTLYKDIAMGSGTFLKPYVRGELKGDVEFSNEYVLNGVTPDSFHQSGFSGLGEIGVGYFDGSNSYSSALFADGGADRFSWGGKIRASFKLN